MFFRVDHNRNRGIKLKGGCVNASDPRAYKRGVGNETQSLIP